MNDRHSSIEAFCEAAASKQPTPGGGSVAALTGALAATMGEMVIQYSVNKRGLESHAPALKTALTQLTRARRMLLELMEEDQQAYEAMREIRKLPEDAPHRSQRLTAATMSCIGVPQAIAATSVAMLELCDRLVDIVNPFLLSDLAVCADLAMATTRCATYNVRINLSEIESVEQRLEMEDASNSVLTRATQLVQRISPRIWARVDAK